MVDFCCYCECFRCGRDGFSGLPSDGGLVERIGEIREPESSLGGRGPQVT